MFLLNSFNPRDLVPKLRILPFYIGSSCFTTTHQEIHVITTKHQRSNYMTAKEDFKSVRMELDAFSTRAHVITKRICGKR